MESKKLYRLIIILCCVATTYFMAACTYLNSAAKQSRYSQIQRHSPSQLNLKYMIDQQTFFIYGRIVDQSNTACEKAITIAAFSNRYVNNEVVDVSHVAVANTHYGLNLPAGDYTILVLCDQDANGTLEQSEVVARYELALDMDVYPDMVVPSLDIQVDEYQTVDWPIDIPVPKVAREQESLFFPKGTIQNLNSPLFDRQVALLGLYEPAAFLDRVPTMFYALEEDSFKSPVIFVHGIGGSTRNFEHIVAALDRERYKPWFFYYPSGSDLNQLSEMFYEIFLSGRAVAGVSRPVIVIAHSMGGVVVREALNNYQGREGEVSVDMLITLASPFGGHPDAAKGVKHSPMVVPSWKDLDPQSDFISGLFRKPLPAGIHHHLLYAYGNPSTLKLGSNSDGVVPLHSQLTPAAQSQAEETYGFNNSHTGILADDTAIDHIIEVITELGSPYPKAHIEANIAGGFAVALGPHYSRVEKYYIHHRGRFMALLANGTLDTLGDPVLEHFVAVAQGRAESSTDPERAWVKFVKDYPAYAE